MELFAKIVNGLRQSSECASAFIQLAQNLVDSMKVTRCKNWKQVGFALQINGIVSIWQGLHNERVKGTSIETQFFNIGTTRYHTSKYLANLLTPSGKSDWRLSKNEISKMERKPRNGQMILFDVKCLFTKVPLDTTIAVILRNICDKGKIERYIPRKVIKELLHLCAKHVHCTLRKIQ